MKKATRIAVWAGFAGGAAAIATLSPLVELSPVSAAPASKTKVTKTSTKKTTAQKPAAQTRAAQKPVAQKPAAPQAAKKMQPLPRYLSVQQLDLLRKARGGGPSPRLVPTAGGEPLPNTLKTLPGVIPVGNFDGDVSKLPALKSRQVSTRVSNQRRTPSLPRPVPPATINRRAAAPTTVPRWVRYPLEFQLCGIGLGTRAVDKDRFNRIDRYGLFAMHGNPTAVVVPIVTQQAAGGPGGAEGGAPGGAPGGFPGGGFPGAGGPGGGASLPTAAVATSTLTVQQTPPLAGASLFPGDQNGNLPDWASAVTVQLDNNHVQWLYKRDTYAMGFVVDRLGYVDAIVVAGTESPIAKTQLEDPVHTVKLGDDLRKVMFRYGYPDTVETYPVNVSASVTAGGAVNPGGITAPPPAVAPGGFPGAEGAAGAAVAGGNGVFRTFEVRYEQSYNVVFTIRNNRVARIYIFGDPDFFNAQRRQRFRTAY